MWDDLNNQMQILPLQVYGCHPITSVTPPPRTKNPEILKKYYIQAWYNQPGVYLAWRYNLLLFGLPKVFTISDLTVSHGLNLRSVLTSLIETIKDKKVNMRGEIEHIRIIGRNEVMSSVAKINDFQVFIEHVGPEDQWVLKMPAKVTKKVTA